MTLEADTTRTRQLANSTALEQNHHLCCSLEWRQSVSVSRVEEQRQALRCNLQGIGLLVR